LPACPYCPTPMAMADFSWSRRRLLFSYSKAAKAGTGGGALNCFPRTHWGPSRAVAPTHQLPRAENVFEQAIMAEQRLPLKAVVNFLLNTREADLLKFRGRYLNATAHVGGQSVSGGDAA
jgi:hypothetical protein